MKQNTLGIASGNGEAEGRYEDLNQRDAQTFKRGWLRVHFALGLRRRMLGYMATNDLT